MYIPRIAPIEPPANAIPNNVIILILERPSQALILSTANAANWC